MPSRGRRRAARSGRESGPSSTSTMRASGSSSRTRGIAPDCHESPSCQTTASRSPSARSSSSGLSPREPGLEPRERRLGARVGEHLVDARAQPLLVELGVEAADRRAHGRARVAAELLDQHVRDRSATRAKPSVPSRWSRSAVTIPGVTNALNASRSVAAAQMRHVRRRARRAYAIAGGPTAWISASRSSASVGMSNGPSALELPQPRGSHVSTR